MTTVHSEHCSDVTKYGFGLVKSYRPRRAIIELEKAVPRSNRGECRNDLATDANA
jgi:hypothetical protein